MTGQDWAATRRFRIDFSEALHFLLPARHRGRAIDHRLQFKASIKNVVEALGVPHTEVGRIEADGQPVGWSHIPAEGSRIAVEAVVAPLDVTRRTLLQPEPLERLCFVADENVGRLAVLLRTLGLDTAYAPGWDDRRIVDCAEAQGRTVLSKDVEMLKRRGIRFGRLVRAVLPDDQLREVVAFFGIHGPYRLFSRCLRCNHGLVRVDKADILEELEPKTRIYYHRFKRCPGCGRIYWQGSHHDHVIRRLEGAGIDVGGKPPPPAS